MAPLVAFLAMLAAATALDDGLPAYLYGDPMHVECISRSARSQTGDEAQWEPFPTCVETGRPLELHYGHEGELNCTVAVVPEPLFRLLERYVRAEVPLACGVAARPWRPAEQVGAPAPAPVARVPLVVALAGALASPNLMVATHLNVLLHATAPAHGGSPRPHDAGVLDAAAAYSTSPLGSLHQLVVGGSLPLKLSVRWLPTPALPRIDGRVQWRGLPASLQPGVSVYSALAFIGGLATAAACFFLLRPRRGARANPVLGGATPIGYGLNGGGGWGYKKPKRRD